jgi:hypothetical protein
MTNNLVNLSIAKSLYCEKKNYLDTFSPFVLMILNQSEEFISTSDVYLKLQENFNLTIPQNTLKAIFSLLCSKGLIRLNTSDRNYWTASLKENGRAYILKYIEDEKAINRRQQKLISEFINFTQTKYSKTYNENTVQNKIMEYLNKNLSSLAVFSLDDNNMVIINNNEEVNEFEDHFTNYIIKIEKENPELYEILLELLKGAILWNHVAKTNNIEKEKPFKNLIIYLDSNFILGLFNFRPQSINCAAQQLLDLLKRNKSVYLRVLKITLDEISRLFNECKRSRDSYSDIAVSSICYQLKKMKFDDLKIDMFIQNLEQKLHQMDILVENCTLVNENNLSGSDRDLFEKLYRVKTNLNQSKYGLVKSEKAIYASTLHDLTAILLVKKRRGTWTKSLETSNAVFLTSSPRLNTFIDKISQVNSTFPETILDITLTNILWLKNPESDVGCTVKQIIAHHSKNYLVNEAIWRRFIFTLKELREQKNISDEDFAYLISKNQMTEKYLRKSEINEITPDSVLELRTRILNERKSTHEELLNKTKLLKQKDENIHKANDENIQLSSEINKLHSENVQLKADYNELKKEFEYFKNTSVHEIKILEIENKINKKTDEDLRIIKKRFFIDFVIYIGIAILLLVGERILSLPKVRTYYGISTPFYFVLNALLLVGATILLNKASARNFIIKLKWLFRRSKLRDELYKENLQNYES